MLSEAFGPMPAMAVPLKGTLWDAGEPFRELVAIAIYPVSAPTAAGANSVDTLQLEPGKTCEALLQSIPPEDCCGKFEEIARLLKARV